MAQNNIFNRIKNAIVNKFNQAFIYQVGGGFTSYDVDGKSYLDNGYNVNPFVFSIINQQAIKTASIPYYIKEVEDKKAKNKLDVLLKATDNNLTPQQQIKKILLENKAFKDGLMDMPLEVPNPNQSWSEFHALYKTFLKLTGNVYIYMLKPEEGMNAGTPIAIYILPSHNIEIVVKDKVSLLGTESPVKGYMLIEGRQYLEFEAENVIHIKYSNPNYSEDGEHLYGQSPLRAALKNLQSSNKGLDLNIKTLQNGGAFGLIHGKSAAFTENQAKELKERLTEMNNNPEDLAKIAGVSAEVGFTRLSLTSAELKPFDYLKFDKQQIADVLNWMIDDENRGDFGGTINEIKKSRVTDNIQPDLLLLQDALNKYFLPLFKGYENSELIYDISELPEMQQDTKTTVEWVKILLDSAVINRAEARDILTFVPLEDDNMKVFTVVNDLLTLDEAIESEFNIEPPIN